MVGESHLAAGETRHDVRSDARPDLFEQLQQAQSGEAAAINELADHLNDIELDSETLKTLTSAVAVAGQRTTEIRDKLQVMNSDISN